MSASQDARQILLELSMLAGGSTQNLNASRGGGEALGPSGDGKAGRESHHGNLFVYWSQAFASAAWDALPGLVEQAREDLDSFKRRKAPLDAAQDPEKERAALMLEQGEGLEVAQVAAAFGYSHKRVIDLRVIDGRDPVRGEKSRLRDDDAAKRAECERLRREGISFRAIHIRTGVPLATVHRWVKP